MSVFVIINRRKLFYAFALCGSAFMMLGTGALLLARAKGANISTGLFAATLAVTALILPLCILGVAWFDWWDKDRRKRKVFNTPPLDQLGSIGFQIAVVNHRVQHLFTELTIGGIVNDFIIICNADKKLPGYVQFVAMTKRTPFRIKDALAVRSRLRRHGITDNMGEPIKVYSRKQLKHLSIEQLQQNLEEFTEILMAEDFEPNYNLPGYSLSQSPPPSQRK